MILISLILLSALLIEGIGVTISVIGLAALFAASPIVIVMAIALDIGKVVAVSFVYQTWHRIGLLMRTYMTAAVIVLMMITSAGVFGFLSREFQKAIVTTSSQTVKIEALTAEQTRLQNRKLEIDKQIAQLPANSVRGRRQLIASFDSEVSRINSRLIEIDKELPTLKVETLDTRVKVGPILYVAEAFNTTPEIAVKWLILLIIFVFDPLAISLLLAANFLIRERRESAKPLPKKESPIKKVIDTINTYSNAITDLDTVGKNASTNNFDVYQKGADEEWARPSSKINIEDNELKRVDAPVDIEIPETREASSEKDEPIITVLSPYPEKEPKELTIGEKHEQSEPAVSSGRSDNSNVDNDRSSTESSGSIKVVDEGTDAPDRVIHKTSLDSIDSRTGDVTFNGDNFIPGRDRVNALRKLYSGDNSSFL